MPPPRLLALGLRCASRCPDPLPPAAEACGVWRPPLVVSRYARQHIDGGRRQKARSRLRLRRAPRGKNPLTCRRLPRACGRCRKWTPACSPGSAAAVAGPLASLWLDERRSKRLDERLSKRRAASAARREEAAVWWTRVTTDLNTERGAARHRRSRVGSRAPPVFCPPQFPPWRAAAAFLLLHPHPRQSTYR